MYIGWKNNISESYNSKTKSYSGDVKHTLFQLAMLFNTMFERQKDDFKAALYGGGDYKLARWVQNLYKNRALWERLGKAGQEKQFNKNRWKFSKQIVKGRGRGKGRRRMSNSQGVCINERRCSFLYLLFSKSQHYWYMFRRTTLLKAARRVHHV